MGKSERLLLLEKELKIYKKALSEAADVIINEGVSNYPIFVAHQHEINFGLPLMEKEKIKGNWNINASSLEEFVVKKILHKDKLDAFKKNYKEPESSLCVFVLSELGANFIYIPR